MGSQLKTNSVFIVISFRETCRNGKRFKCSLRTGVLRILNAAKEKDA